MISLRLFNSLVLVLPTARLIVLVSSALREYLNVIHKRALAAPPFKPGRALSHATIWLAKVQTGLLIAIIVLRHVL